MIVFSTNPQIDDLRRQQQELFKQQESLQWAYMGHNRTKELVHNVAQHFIVGAPLVLVRGIGVVVMLKGAFESLFGSLHLWYEMRSQAREATKSLPQYQKIEAQIQQILNASAS